MRDCRAAIDVHGPEWDAGQDAGRIHHPGARSSIHLGQELLFERTGIKLADVAYRGQPQALIDMTQGRLHFGLTSQSLALPLIEAGKLCALDADILALVAVSLQCADRCCAPALG